MAAAARRHALKERHPFAVPARGGTTNIAIINSVASNNGFIGIEANNGPATTVAVDNTAITGNANSGVAATGTTHLLLSRSIVTGNGTGVSNRTSPNTLYSYGDNRINGNLTDVASGTVTISGEVSGDLVTIVVRKPLEPLPGQREGNRLALANIRERLSLLYGERADWIPRVRMILEHGESQTFVPFDRVGYRRELEGKTLAAVLDEFARARKENLAALGALKLAPADLDRHLP